MPYLEPISIKDLRDNLSTIVEQVAIGKKMYSVTKFGKEKVVIAPKEKLQDTKSKKINWDNEPFFGMWKDREDMNDAVKWVRDVRKKGSMRYTL